MMHDESLSILSNWNNGRLERWKIGMMECCEKQGNDGIMEYWKIGKLKRSDNWNYGKMENWNGGRMK